MSQPDGVESLLGKWRSEVKRLEEKPEEIKEQQDSHYKGSWDAAREVAEPKLQRKAIEDCVEDLEESDTTDQRLESLADWRNDADELDKRILDSTEWFKSNIRRVQLESCIEEFERAMPDEHFEECFRCGSLQKPVSDKRHRKGYRWECEDCGY